MINLSERRANIGDYSLSFHLAIAELTEENRRLQIMIDDLLNKIECLRCTHDLQAFGSA
jgi:hypothetical protein